MRPEVERLDINKVVNVPTSLNKLKKKNVVDLDFDQLIIAPVDLTKLSDVVSKEVGINTKMNKLNMKIK